MKLRLLLKTFLNRDEFGIEDNHESKNRKHYVLDLFADL